MEPLEGLSLGDSWNRNPMFVACASLRTTTNWHHPGEIILWFE